MSSDEGRPKRSRTAQACISCRVRKTRCDGKSPCTLCKRGGHTCSYEEKPGMKTKTELIYEGILELQKRAEYIEGRLANIPTETIQPAESEKNETGVAAILLSSHTSSTDSFFEWAPIKRLPKISSLRSTFDLEQNRPPRKTGSGEIPQITPVLRTLLLGTFQRNVNFWYPVLSTTLIRQIDTDLEYQDTCLQCLSMLVMALGSAAGFVEGTYKPFDQYFDSLIEFEEVSQIREPLFEAACKILPTVIIEDSLVSCLCLFYFAVYLSFVRRPLQVATFINSAVRKCKMLLAYHRDNLLKQEIESLTRVYWACYIVESDLVAEISKLPLSFSVSMESNSPLPSDFYSHDNVETSRLSSVYFLACISIRRLLNRVHSLLYAEEVSEERILDIGLIMELNYQLESWYKVLPDDLKFPKNTTECSNDYQGFLRQRYFACQSVIFRPIFNYVTQGASEGRFVDDPVILNYAKKCLLASFTNLTNIRSFVHTVMIDTWICALSMATILLLFYMAIHTPQLAGYVVDEIKISDILESSLRVEELLQQWVADLDDHNPTVLQCFRIMDTIRQSIEAQSAKGELTHL